MPPSGDFLFFSRAFSAEGQMSFRFLRVGCVFTQLGACEYECFRLAGALATDANDRAILLETLAAGKYLQSSRFCYRLVIPDTRLLDKH